MSMLVSKLLKQQRNPNFVDKLLATKLITKEQAEELEEVRKEWRAGNIIAGCDVTLNVVCESIAVVNDIPRSTFRTWLGRRGVKNVTEE